MTEKKFKTETLYQGKYYKMIPFPKVVEKVARKKGILTESLRTMYRTSPKPRDKFFFEYGYLEVDDFPVEKGKRTTRYFIKL